MYAAVDTRVDIAHVVNQLYHNQEDPLKEHLLCAKKVLWYVKDTQCNRKPREIGGDDISKINVECFSQKASSFGD